MKIAYSKLRKSTQLIYSHFAAIVQPRDFTKIMAANVARMT